MRLKGNKYKGKLVADGTCQYVNNHGRCGKPTPEDWMFLCQGCIDARARKRREVTWRKHDLREADKARKPGDPGVGVIVGRTRPA